MAVGAADYVNMFFAKLFVEKSGGKDLIWTNCFVADWAGAAYSGFTGWVTVGTAGNCHKLVWNFHRAENFLNELLANKKLRTANRTFYRQHIFFTFFFESLVFLFFIVSQHTNQQSNNYDTANTQE